MSAIGTDIDRAVQVLRGGGMLGLPTETVYGLGADAANVAAVARIYAAKQRPIHHPLIVHIAGVQQLEQWAIANSSAKTLAQHFWPGPLTLICQRGPNGNATVTGGAATIGVRVPRHPLALALLEKFGGGVAAPSANRFGKVSPTRAFDVHEELGSAVDYILDGGECEVGIESTIVDVSGEVPTLLRPGAITRVDLERVIGMVGNPTTHSPQVSGSLPSHYAPNATVIVATRAQLNATIATLLSQSNQSIAVLAPLTWVTIASDQLRMFDVGEQIDAMARNLYAGLRDLDRSGAKLIVAALPDDHGLGEAVIDRLRKAAAPRGHV